MALAGPLCGAATPTSFDGATTSTIDPTRGQRKSAASVEHKPVRSADPLEGNGRALRGTQSLDEFWSSREVEMPKLRMFHGSGDDVLVEAEYPAPRRTVWLLYRFDGRQLVEAIGFASEAEARAYSPTGASG